MRIYREYNQVEEHLDAKRVLKEIAPLIENFKVKKIKTGVSGICLEQEEEKRKRWCLNKKKGGRKKKESPI